VQHLPVFDDVVLDQHVAVDKGFRVGGVIDQVPVVAVHQILSINIAIIIQVDRWQCAVR
jgi:hypothetical protein